MRPATPEHLELLRRRLAATVCLPDTEWAYASAHYRQATFDRGALLAREDRVLTHSHFIVHGLVRLCYTRPDGRDMNAAFVREGHMVGSYVSKLYDAPAGFSIEALEPTTTLMLDHDVADRLLERHPAWARLRQHLLEQLFLARRAREQALLTLSAEERYRQLVAKQSWLLERVAQHHIASYLGITPVALSRIRRRLRDAAVNPG